jgi:hypothetical protein
MIYVYRNGELVEKPYGSPARTEFPAPRVSRFEAFESPVTGQSISSWRQRERDMNAADAVDRRDLPQQAFDKRQRIEERNARAGKT